MGQETKGGKALFTIPLTIPNDITVTGGILELDGDTMITNVSLSGSGNIIADAPMTVTGNFQQSNPASNLRGTGTVTVANKFTWAGGIQEGSGETVAKGGIDITTTSTKTLRERP